MGEWGGGGGGGGGSANMDHKPSFFHIDCASDSYIFWGERTHPPHKISL